MSEQTGAEKLEIVDKILAEPYLRGTLPGSDPLGIPEKLREKINADGYEPHWFKKSDFQNQLNKKQAISCDEPGTPELPDLKLGKIPKSFVEAYRTGALREANEQLKSVQESERDPRESRPRVGKDKSYFVMGGKK
jgi:hypothetical protein